MSILRGTALYRRASWPVALAPMSVIVASGACGQAKVMSSGDPSGSSAGQGGTKGGAGGDAGSGNGADPGINVDLDAATTPVDAGVTAPGATSCAEESHDGKMVPVDLLFLVDTSGSMEEAAGANSKWVAMRDAINAFLADGKSAGAGVGLTFFPLPSKSCAQDDDCADTLGTCDQNGVCAEGGVPPADLTTNQDICDVGVDLECDRGTCAAYGLCAVTGLRCPNVGQPCAGGLAGNTCIPEPKLCTYDDTKSCDTACYQTPVVAIADLPAPAAAIAKAFAAISPSG